MKNNSKILDDIINSQRTNHDKYVFGYNQTKRDQAPKRHIKKHIQKAMQKQLEGIGSSTRKITRTLLHREDSDFIINENQKQTGLEKKKDSKE
jgi:hypothetical protein